MKQSNWFWFSIIIVGAMIYILNSLSAIFFPFFMGLIGAYALNGTVTRLEKYKLSRGVSSAILILAVILALVLLIMVFIPFVQQQLITLATNVPSMVESAFITLKPLLERSSYEFGTPSPTDLKVQITSHLGDIMTWSIKLITNLFSNSMALANILSLIILTPVIMFYLLKDWPKLIEAIEAIIPRDYVKTAHDYALRIDTTLSGYAKGQASVCLILMILYAISLTVIGLPQGFFIGIMTGFMSFIPYVGMITGLLASIAISLANLAGMNQIIAVISVFAIIGAIEGNLLAPRLIGERVGLHPVWIIFSLLAGATWFGFLGILVALPTAAMIGVIVRIMNEWYHSSPFYLGKHREARPTA